MFRPRVLVFYGTTTGQTRKIAQELSATIRAAHLDVDLVDVRDRRDLNVSSYDGVIVAAPIRSGRYARPVRRWVQAHAAALRIRPTAFVTVCLAVLEKSAKADAAIAAIMKGFFDEAGWQPTVTKTVAGALFYTRYDWFTRWIMRRIVARAHGDTDTSRDYEYTDWDELRAFGREFGERVAAGRPLKVAV